VLQFCEDDLDEMHRRQEDINNHYGCTFADLGAMRWLPRLGEDNVLMSFDNGRAHHTTVNKYLGRKNYAVRRDGAGNLFVCTIGTPPPPKPFEPIEWRRAAQLQAKPPQPRPEIWAPKPKNWGG
jgi:hypothetical protein